MRLRPGVRVLWRGPGEMQVGTDRRWSLRFVALEPAEERALALLEDGTWRATRTASAPPGVTPQRWTELLGPLHDADLLIDPRLPPSPAPGPAERTVAVVGLGRVGVLVAQSLAASGIGFLVLDDPGPVTGADVGPAGYRRADLGAPRQEAAARLVHETAVSTRTTADAAPDLVVLVERHVASPVRARALMAHDLWHLSVVVREADIVVGPLVVPGSSACLRCLDLHRTDRDELWPVVAAQLACPPRSRTGWATAGTAGTRGSAGAADGIGPAGAITAAGLAAGQVTAALAWPLGGSAPAVLSATLEVDSADGIPAVRTWAVHPTCGCTGLPG